MGKTKVGIAAAAVVGCLCLPGCRTTFRVAKGVTKVGVGTVRLAAGVAVGTVKVAATVVKDFAYYAQRAATYRTFHDSGKLHSRDVSAALAKSRARRRFPLPAVYKGSYRWPLGAGIVSSEFGKRWGKRHQGIDIAADEGEPVFASASGRVIYAGNGLRGYGNTVILGHDDKTTTLYAHNSGLKVDLGQSVYAGQTIALLGSTGRSTGPHVHFEIRRHGSALDPRKLLPRSRF